MDLQTRKLNFIQEVLLVSNEKIMEKLEELLEKEQQKLDPVLKDRLASRAFKAEQDIAEGRTMSREQLEEKLNARLGL